MGLKNNIYIKYNGISKDKSIIFTLCTSNNNNIGVYRFNFKYVTDIVLSQILTLETIVQVINLLFIFGLVICIIKMLIK